MPSDTYFAHICAWCRHDRKTYSAQEETAPDCRIRTPSPDRRRTLCQVPREEWGLLTGAIKGSQLARRGSLVVLEARRQGAEIAEPVVGNRPFDAVVGCDGGSRVPREEPMPDLVAHDQAKVAPRASIEDGQMVGDQHHFPSPSPKSVRPSSRQLLWHPQLEGSRGLPSTLGPSSCTLDLQRRLPLHDRRPENNRHHRYHHHKHHRRRPD